MMRNPDPADPRTMFRLDGRTAVVTGAGGALCGAMAAGLARAGGAVALLDLNAGDAERVAGEIAAEGGMARAFACNALERASLAAARDEVVRSMGPPSVLVCGVGGNDPSATTSADTPFEGLPEEAVRRVFDLNFMSAFLACQVFGPDMARAGHGSIITVSSMNALRPLTRIPAYSAAKAAVANFTQWLAVHMAQEHSPSIRVNAIAPGFFLTRQNRFLLQDAAGGDWTDRGRTILAHTPAGRFGAPGDLVGATVWLASGASEFVTGITLPVDGGFSAWSGV